MSQVELGLIFAFWTLLALLAAASRLLDPRSPGLQFGFPSGPVGLAFFESYLWAALTPPIFWLAGRFGIERHHRVRRVLLLLGTGVAVALMVDLALDFARFYLFDIPRRRGFGFSPWRPVARLWFLNDLVVYFAVLAAGFARDYFRRFHARQDEAIRLQAHAAQLQAQLTEARLEALRMQINPHFLFNTLHAISTLVERDPRGVRRMISRLSELLRYTLDGGEPEVSLDQELSFLQRYLDIMHVRFQGRLEVEMHIAPDVRDALLPNLILQPLVENAIKHGVNQMQTVGKIELHAARDGDWLVLTVRDNGPGVEPASSAENGATPPGEAEGGLGLRNTRARLEQLYGSEQRLMLQPAPGCGTTARIELPYHTRADLRAAFAPDAHRFAPSGMADER